MFESNRAMGLTWPLLPAVEMWDQRCARSPKQRNKQLFLLTFDYDTRYISKKEMLSHACSKNGTCPIGKVLRLLWKLWGLDIFEGPWGYLRNVLGFLGVPQNCLKVVMRLPQSYVREPEVTSESPEVDHGLPQRSLKLFEVLNISIYSKTWIYQTSRGFSSI